MKEINTLIKLGKNLGFTITRTKGDHFAFTGYGKTIIVSSTLSDYRISAMTKKNLRKISTGKTVTKP
jgi:predicted RNA binding protein YcfA (HicA-like mRNA interferase family)